MRKTVQLKESQKIALRLVQEKMAPILAQAQALLGEVVKEAGEDPALPWQLAPSQQELFLDVTDE